MRGSASADASEREEWFRASDAATDLYLAAMRRAGALRRAFAAMKGRQAERGAA
jgi:hypothetical protein